MATTVYGCVNWANGEITFANLENCLVQSSCVYWTGEHAGMVALTLSNAYNEDCNDTFYGCVNWGTGKFQVSIPEGCCYDCVGYVHSDDDCVGCDVDYMPTQVQVRFTGVKKCSTQLLWETFNSRLFCLNQSENPCIYELTTTFESLSMWFQYHATGSDLLVYNAKPPPVPTSIYFECVGTDACFALEGSSQSFVNVPTDFSYCDTPAVKNYGGYGTVRNPYYV